MCYYYTAWTDFSIIISLSIYFCSCKVYIPTNACMHACVVCWVAILYSNTTPFMLVAYILYYSREQRPRHDYIMMGVLTYVENNYCVKDRKRA